MKAAMHGMRVTRARAPRKTAWLLLALLLLGPIGTALAETPGTPNCTHWGAHLVGRLAAPPAPCRSLSVSACCDHDAQQSGTTPQPPASARALALLDAPHARETRPELRLPDAPELLRSERLAHSTVVLLL
jgi:hypothetical protein